VGLWVVCPHPVNPRTSWFCEVGGRGASLRGAAPCVKRSTPRLPRQTPCCSCPRSSVRSIGAACSRARSTPLPPGVDWQTLPRRNCQVDVLSNFPSAIDGRARSMTEPAMVCLALERLGLPASALTQRGRVIGPSYPVRVGRKWTRPADALARCWRTPTLAGSTQTADEGLHPSGWSR
jgi:hypothetical protein